MAKHLRFSSDHRVVGVQFLATGFLFLLIGGALALALRAEVTLPGANLIDPEDHARLFTNHGTVMLYLWLLPAMAGLIHAALPSTLGVAQPRNPRLGALSFWLLPVGGALLIASFFLGGATAGWTASVPLALRAAGLGQTLWTISVMILLISVLLSAIGFFSTITGEWSRDIWDAPLFAWGVLTGSVVAMICTPLLLIGLGAQAAIRLGAFSEGIFSSALGVAVWANLFWFFAHPAGFVVLLPAFGTVTEIVQTFSGQRVLSHRRVAQAMAAIGGLGILSWGQHLVVSGTLPGLRVAFMLASLLLAVPAGYIVFSWMAAMWGGTVQFSTPMLFSLGTISILLVGAVGSAAMAAVPTAAQLTGSAFESGNLHFVVFGGAISGLFAGIYYWFPRITGRGFDETAGRLHFLAQFGGAHVAYLPMLWAGLAGLPSRVADFDARFEPMQVATTAGALMLAGAAMIFLYNVFFGWRSGPEVDSDPWATLDPTWGRLPSGD